MDWIKIEISGDDSEFVANELKQTIGETLDLQPTLLRSDYCSDTSDGFLTYVPLLLMVPANEDTTNNSGMNEVQNLVHNKMKSLKNCDATARLFA